MFQYLSSKYYNDDECALIDLVYG